MTDFHQMISDPRYCRSYAVMNYQKQGLVFVESEQDKSFWREIFKEAGVKDRHFLYALKLNSGKAIKQRIEEMQNHFNDTCRFETLIHHATPISNSPLYRKIVEKVKKSFH